MTTPRISRRPSPSLFLSSTSSPPTDPTPLPANGLSNLPDGVQGVEAAGSVLVPADSPVPHVSSPVPKNDHMTFSSSNGVRGIDVFRIAGKSISGFLRSYKTGSPDVVRQAYTTTREKLLALFLEYHPLVARYQRGDATPECAVRYQLPTFLGTPYPIPYVWQGQTHIYLPDFVGTLTDGRLFISEAGLASAKRHGQDLAKADAAYQYAQVHGGVFWIATEEQLGDCWYQNLICFHPRRQVHESFAPVCDAILNKWPWGSSFSIQDAVYQLGTHWSSMEVEATVWKMIGDAAASGHLLMDLATASLQRTTPLIFADPTLAPVLPDPLPHTLRLDEDNQNDGEMEDGSIRESDGVPEDAVHSAVTGIPELPGGSIDPSALDDSSRQRFERLRAAVYDVLAGARSRETAEQYAMAPSELSRYVARAREFGERALIMHGIHVGKPHLHPEVQALIHTLYCDKQLHTVRAIHEHPKLKLLVDQLSQHEGHPVPLPSYRQVGVAIQRLKKPSYDTTQVPDGKAGRYEPEQQVAPHPPRQRMSASSYVQSITAPALICQVDEHHCDIRVVTQDNLEVTTRVYAAVLICVKTAAILSFVLSPHALTEEDYMRLLKQAMEPKDQLVHLFECQHDWPCTAKPSVIFHDRGKIFTSKRATQVIVDRLHIVEEKAPAYAPQAKGTVEALFTWVTRKLMHRLPGTTKSSPRDRGAYATEHEAVKAGISLDVLEMYFTQAIVDDYMQDWDILRRQRRVRLWQDAVEVYGVGHYVGKSDDLKLLLMSSHNLKHPESGRYAVHPYKGLSFHSRWYVNPEVTPRLRGTLVTLYYDRRDITVLYVFLGPQYIGPVYCTTLHGRVSVWEADAMRKHDLQQQREAAADTCETRRTIIGKASSGKAAQRHVARELERKRALDRQRVEIHPAEVHAMTDAIAASLRQQYAEYNSGHAGRVPEVIVPISRPLQGEHLDHLVAITPATVRSHLPPPVRHDELPAPAHHLEMRRRIPAHEAPETSESPPVPQVPAAPETSESSMPQKLPNESERLSQRR